MYTSIQRNLNLSDRVHVDGDIFGPCVIAGVGDHDDSGDLWQLVAAFRRVSNRIKRLS